MSNKKKKIEWKKYIALVIYFVICVVIGIILGREIGKDIKNGVDIYDKLSSWILEFVFIIVALYIHVIIHEAGHFIFGLISGYKFSAFKIMSFMLLKENGKIKLKRVKVAGMGGQCLMIPPKMKDGKIPVMLYNLGGPLMNLAVSIVSFVFLLVVIILGEEKLIAYDVYFAATIAFWAVGMVLALSNGIPIKTKTINNDGYNALELRESRGAMYGFWLQLQANAEIIKGKRLKELPSEWFALPPDEEMKNSMVATIAVYACNRLMDEGKFEEADKLMEHILEIESGIVGIHRNLLMCDRMFCEMIGENRREVLDEMRNKELLKFMNTMKKFPTVLRTEYAYALLVEKDEEKAGNILKIFDKCAKSYPYESDIQTERELMEYAREKYNQQ